MVYKADSLSVLAYANGFTFWHYKTEDSNLTDNEYFKSADNLIRAGDIMLVNSPNKGAMYVVKKDKNKTIILKSMVSVAV